MRARGRGRATAEAKPLRRPSRTRRHPYRLWGRECGYKEVVTL